MNEQPVYAYERKDWPEKFIVSFCSVSSKYSNLITSVFHKFKTSFLYFYIPIKLVFLQWKKNLVFFSLKLRTKKIVDITNKDTNQTVKIPLNNPQKIDSRIYPITNLTKKKK